MFCQTCDYEKKIDFFGDFCDCGGDWIQNLKTDEEQEIIAKINELIPASPCYKEKTRFHKGYPGYWLAKM